jgi:alpha-L-fucosidase
MYEPTIESVKQHPVPDWYQDAKFGIFIHWTISSVPAFAPTGLGDIHNLFEGKSQEYVFAHQPYAEWYLNSLRIPGSPVEQYHREKYGANFRYEDFAPLFNQQAEQWDPEAWAGLFRQAGAQYVVLVTKHHDGFLFWPSKYPNPKMPDYRTTRDVCGELNQAVSGQGMKMGYYYSSALDWSFTTRPVQNFPDLLTNGPTSKAYAKYVENHWKELIDRYDPWVLWSDIGYPPNYNLAELFSYYYNHKPEGVVNDRWFQLPVYLFNPLGRLLLKQKMKQMMQSDSAALPKVPHCDYVTTEYTDYTKQVDFKWESVRGIGNSFTYNQFETENDYLKAPALIRMLVDIVSKNGNLLLNVGPRPDGSIPEPQVVALQGIGAWLAVNGEAIYGTRPWQRFSDTAENGMEVRYTCKDSTVYATVTTLPSDGWVILPQMPICEGLRLSLLGAVEPLEWEKEGASLRVRLPGSLGADDVPVLKIELR